MKHTAPGLVFLVFCMGLGCSDDQSCPAVSGGTPDASADSGKDAGQDAPAEVGWPETGSPETGPADGQAPPDGSPEGGEQDVQPEAWVPVTPEEICDVANPNLLETVRNGSEICDDQAFTVPDPYVPLVIACFASSSGSGIGYIASNTGPACELEEGCCESQVDCPVAERLANEGNERCQGFEYCGCAAQICPCSDAWDHLQYVSDGAGEIRITCPPEGVIRDVDLAEYAGQRLWIGSHTQPDYSGRMTQACVAIKH